jgi:DNA (cytosine-5)-methyltransferase 1
MQSQGPLVKKTIKTLSLFTGAGGLDIGFHQAGYDVRACIEIEPAYCTTLEANNGPLAWFETDVEIHCKSVEDFDPRPYAGGAIDCVIGGPPCQTFSAAGRRAGGVIGTADSRGRLFQRYAEIM